MQDLDSIIEDVTSRLRQGRFPNEQSISQGIVLRLLDQLGWDVYDPTSVWPEYNTGEGRVDFALCHPPSRPAIFIEVKQPGKAESGIRQALEYPFHTGVPFVVLTDGKTWSFYLPAEQGAYDERRVYKLDFFEREPDQASAGKKRQYVARSTDVLYPGRPDLHKNHEVLPGGWLVATNLNNQRKKTVVRAATEVAGLTFGTDVTVDFLKQTEELK